LSCESDKGGGRHIGFALDEICSLTALFGDAPETSRKPANGLLAFLKPEADTEVYAIHFKTTIVILTKPDEVDERTTA
jgi:hypothetical protein